MGGFARMKKTIDWRRATARNWHRSPADRLWAGGLWLGGVLTAGLVGCGPTNGTSDAGADANCSLEIAVGKGDRDGFMPIREGDPAEVILGFQGFRMLEFAIQIVGSDDDQAEVTSFLEVDGTGVEVNQRDRGLQIRAQSTGGGVVENYLLFFNDAPASEIVGYSANLELVVRSGGCVGTARTRIELRDDDTCVSYDAAVPEAGVLDGGIPDGSVACGIMP